MDALPRDNRLALHSTQQVLNDARIAQLSTISHLTEEDVANVWFGVSQFIAAAITNGKGVHLSGLGTFSLSMVDDRTPIFKLSKSFSQTYNLITGKNPSSSNCSVVSLNFAQIAKSINQIKEDVEACYHEIMTALGNHIRTPKPRGISLLFFGIGKLSIRDGKVRFSFFPKFQDNPYTLNNVEDNVEEEEGRPVTVGIIEHLDNISRSSTANKLATPRVLATPTISSLQFSMDDFSPSNMESHQSTSITPVQTRSRPKTQESWINDVLAPSLRPQKTQRLPLSWQASVADGKMLAVVDGLPSEQFGGSDEKKEEEEEEFSFEHELPRLSRKVPIDSVDVEVSENEVEQFKHLSERNLHSTVFLPLTVEKEGQVYQEISRNTVPAPEDIMDVEHRIDRAKKAFKGKKPIISYEDWQRQREEKGRPPSRHRLEIRDQLEQNVDIKRSLEEHDKEQDMFFHNLNKLKLEKAEAIRQRFEQKQREDREKVAGYNMVQKLKKKTTTKEIEKTIGTEDGSDVFVFRPSTSHHEIQQQNKDHSFDLLAQSATKKLNQAYHAEQEAKEGKASLAALKRAEEQEVELKLEQRMKQLHEYKASLDAQINYKTQLEESVKKVHPRQPVPFDLKHLPGSDKNMQRPNSAIGRPAVALGPEMYKEHDRREKRMQANAKRMYAKTMELQAERNRRKLEAAEREAKHDKEALSRVLESFKADNLRNKEQTLQKRQQLQEYWNGQKGIKQEKDIKEMEERKLPADIPIKDQMDYRAYVNGFG
eukprot:m.63203 g.63203  ORF g.63203 m.63203 type:complete len:766 (+) comp8062_c0_seq1:118-2415(+)